MRTIAIMSVSPIRPAYCNADGIIKCYKNDTGTKRRTIFSDYVGIIIGDQLLMRNRRVVNSISEYSVTSMKIIDGMEEQAMS